MKSCHKRRGVRRRGSNASGVAGEW